MISETLSLTHYVTGRGTDGDQVPLTQVTGDTANILEYLYSGFYYKVWYKDNDGTSNFDLRQWLGVTHRVGRPIYYHLLTKRGIEISIYTVQRVMNLELATSNVTEIYRSFNEKITRSSS